MSSRSQTKSLDRDIQLQPKRKNSFPLNIQQVHNSAEHLVCNYHNKIENIFELYPINRFEEELSNGIVSNYISEIGNKLQIDTMGILKLSQCIRMKLSTKSSTEPQELILTFLDFVINCQNLFQGITNKLLHTVINGLLRYCISLAKFCATDIEFVINYEKLIQKNESDIRKEVKDIENQMRELKKCNKSSRLILENTIQFVACVRKIRASINKLYYLVTEWVDEERNYPLNLTDEMKLVKSELFTTEQRTSKNDYSIKRRQLRIISLEKRSKTLEKNYLKFKRKLNHVRQSQDLICMRLDEIDNQTTSRVDELKTLKNKIKSLEYVKQKPNKKVQIPRYKMSMEIHIKKTEKRDFEAQTIRIEDNKMALNRHKDRLSKLSEELRNKITMTKSQMAENQITIVKLKENLQDDINFQQKDIDHLKKLQLKLKDINFISMKKRSPDTLRQLHHNGHLANDSRDLNLTDKMCDILSRKFIENWKELYIHLPMQPDRTIDQRCHDIDIIDAISARNDSTPKEQMKMCLNKWRLFYHNATPEHLIEGLQKSNNRDIASELKIETLKSKNRFEDEDPIDAEDKTTAEQTP